jgi:putative flippase GtrA
MAALRQRSAPRAQAGARDATPMTESPMRAQFLRYAGAGAVGTLAQYASLVALVQAQWTGPVQGATLGAILGALVNYVLNHRYTFGSGRRHTQALPRFAAVAAAGIAINALVVAVLVHAGIHYLVAQVAATAVVLVAGYLANRTWTF